MGVQKLDSRPLMYLGGDDRVMPTEALGSTSGDLDTYGVSIITATATGLVYQLQTPAAGRPKIVSVDYTGATGNLTIANVSTGTVFDGSTANVITVSSSQEHVTIHLTGLSTARWASLLTSTGVGMAFAGSTVTS